MSTIDLLNKVNYVLVRLEEGKDGVFEELNQSGFSMMNIDVDGDNIPYALFVRDELTKREIKEWFVSYSVKSKGNIRQKLLPASEHPIEWVVKMNKERKKEKDIYIIHYFKEVYQTLKDVDILRF